MRLLALLPYLLFMHCLGKAQPPSFTANDVVPKFEGHFGFGSNMGYFPPHYYDEQLAVLAHGSPDGSVPGVGVTCIRPALFEHFLDYFGYDIRLNTFKLYDSIGLRHNTVFLGFPAAHHRDSTFYCPGHMGELFKNMYEPIWDDGANGTPVNDKNPYALYVWKTVSTYKDYVKFWEIWNEPDFDMQGNGWKPIEMEGNWWLNTPNACETITRAPVFHYIRMLRISYEVIKSVDPFAYVAIGGIGYPSYLDVICRFTDNPNGGTATSKFPKKGGAYFDALSYHSYPHVEDAMRKWDNNIAGFKYSRHSDAGVDGVWKKKDEMEFVLEKFGYNGSTHPKKLWIITEINIPRKQYGEFIGSDKAQTNFMMKALILAPTHDIRQMYIYSLSDNLPENEAENEFSFMGLFENLVDVKPFGGKANPVAVGFKTTSDLLHEKDFDSLETARLRLPPNVRGVAYRDEDGETTYALWAKTELDHDETAFATYSFPTELNIKYLEQRYWHSGTSGAKKLANAQQVFLDGSPSFFTPVDIDEDEFPKTPKVSPNPVSDGYSLYSFWQFSSDETTIEVFDSAGRKVMVLAEKTVFAIGPNQILLNWGTLAAGTYFIRLRSGGDSVVVPVVKI